MNFLNAIFKLFGLKVVDIKPDEIREAPIPVVGSTKRDFRGAVALIKKWEGFRADSYQCSAGRWTIGWGTTKGVKPGDKITREQAEKLLLDDVFTERVPAVERLVKVPLTNNEMNALISFVYNIGVGNFEGSTLLKMLNQGLPRAVVADQFDRWVFAKGKRIQGLANRRADEKRVFLTPDMVPIQLG